MNTRRLFAGLAVVMGVLAATGLTGCNVFQIPDTGVVEVTGLDTPNPDNVAPALDIQNHRGTVTVVVDPKVLEPQVRARPMVGGRVEQQVRWTAASMMLDNGRPVLRVLSTPEETGAPDVPVELTVTMPRVGGVRVHNDQGPVILRGVRGAVEVQNSLGAYDGKSIFVETPHALKDPVLLSGGVGDVEVRAGAGSAGRLVVNSGTGRVTIDGARARMEDVKFQRGMWTGTVNGGESEQRIATETGNVLVVLGAADLLID